MRIAIGSDHAGFSLKEELKEFLIKKGYQVKDVGAFSDDSVDYPEFSEKVAVLVSQKKADRGIVICGTGIGVSIVANKVPGVRAALCQNVFTARYSRRHNDSNVLALGARVVELTQAKKIIITWLTTSFEGGRHERRVKQIKKIEDKYLKC